ncbi:MAG TPA: molybdenum cofactor guanylyltransferase [Thermoplasmata archaeon]|nr:molybdenum cofactor guanylyltransferase [Thermoplasmata archaeon]
MRSAILLAGGASRRFGSPKALAPFRGRAMIEWAAEALRPLADELLVSVADAAQAEALHERLPDVRFVTDARHDRGPIEGLDRGLRAARGDLVLVAPCDAPLLRTDLYVRFLERIGPHEAAVPRLQALDPVRAAYRRTAAVRVLDREGLDIPSPSALVDRLDAVFLAEGELRAVDPRLASFLDVNSLEELARAEAQARIAPR